jgi:hypothetical protein
MNRYAIAAILTAALGGTADAQQPVLNPQALPGPRVPLLLAPNPFSGSQFLPIGPPPAMPSLNPPAHPTPPPTPGPPVTTPGAGFYKSGGVFIGTGGVYPYDSGNWLVGGTDGFARSVGTFTMVPGVSAAAGAGGWGDGGAAPAAACGPRCRLFRR